MWKRLAVISMFLLVVHPARAAEPPKVLVSIKPLHGLVASVMAGVGEPGLLVSGNASPHGYALKPSDGRALEQAALLIWVGKDFETWLERPAARVKNRIAMANLPGLQRLPTREGGAWESHSHHHGHHESRKKDDNDEWDGHVWLDADNAVLLVKTVAEKLAQMDEPNSQRYGANAARTIDAIRAKDGTLRQRLASVAAKPYVVFHDAQQYFEARYSLSPAGAMTVDPDRPLSSKRLATLRDRLKTSGAACVFAEPRHGEAAARALAEAAQAGQGVLDPEGLMVEAGPGAWHALMDGLADSLTACLSAR